MLLVVAAPKPVILKSTPGLCIFWGVQITDVKYEENRMWGYSWRYAWDGTDDIIQMTDNLLLREPSVHTNSKQYVISDRWYPGARSNTTQGVLHWHLVSTL